MAKNKKRWENSSKSHPRWESTSIQGMSKVLVQRAPECATTSRNATLAASCREGGPWRESQRKFAVPARVRCPAKSRDAIMASRLANAVLCEIMRYPAKVCSACLLRRCTVMTDGCSHGVFVQLSLCNRQCQSSAYCFDPQSISAATRARRQVGSSYAPFNPSV